MRSVIKTLVIEKPRVNIVSILAENATIIGNPSYLLKASVNKRPILILDGRTYPNKRFYPLSDSTVVMISKQLSNENGEFDSEPTVRLVFNDFEKVDELFFEIGDSSCAICGFTIEMDFTSVTEISDAHVNGIALKRVINGGNATFSYTGNEAITSGMVNLGAEIETREICFKIDKVVSGGTSAQLDTVSVRHPNGIIQGTLLSETCDEGIERYVIRNEKGSMELSEGEVGLRKIYSDGAEENITIKSEAVKIYKDFTLVEICK